MKDTDILFIISKIFNDYDEKNGVIQKVDYTQRAKDIIDAWQSVNNQGLNIELICKLHRIICNNEDIAINDEQGNIIGYTKAGEYRTHPSSRKSELKVGARRLFVPPEVIAQKMEQLVSIMNTVLATKLSQEQMVENVLSFAVEFSTIHPFANQNGRMMQLLMELVAYQAGLKPFYVSRVNKLNSYLLTRAIEETIFYQTVQPLKTIINRYKSEQNISNIKINDKEGIGSFFGHTKRKNKDTVLHKTILSLLPPLKNIRVLDAGCGIGTYAKYFVENGATVIGIDASQVAIDKANKMTLEQATFMVGDLEKPLDYFDNESFDFIFSYLVIHYIEDWDKLFQDFSRILKVGGSILLSVSHPNRNIASNYFLVEKVTEVFYTETANINIEYYRRPFQMMLNPMIQAGFQIKNTIEFNQETGNPTNIVFVITKIQH